MNIKKSLLVLTAGAVSLSMAACSSSDTGDGSGSIPKQVTIIVPWAAGGGSDQATRQLAIAAESTCGTKFVIQNKTGAAGATGHEAGAAAKADGATLTDITAELTILPYLGNTTASSADFEPIVRFASISPAFVVPADSKYQTIDDLMADMEAGATVRVGTTGPGGIWDIAAGGFEQETGAKFSEHVPFDGGASIIQAVLGGHLEVGVLAAPEVVAQYQSGDLRVLAIADDQRAEILPDVPTLKEQGIEWATRTWFGFAAPAGTDAQVVSSYEKCFQEAWDTAEYQEFIKNKGFNAAFLDAAGFKEFLAEQDSTNEQLVNELYNG